MLAPHPTLTYPAGFTWRPAVLADMPALYAAQVASAAADDTGPVGSLADLELEFADPWSDAAVDSLIGLAPDGTLAACGRVFANPTPGSEAHAYLFDVVHPAYRGQRLEDFLLNWLEARGWAKLEALDAAHPGERTLSLRLGSPTHLTERVARVEAHGFSAVRTFYRMRRDLHQPIPELAVPAGISVQAFRPELSTRVHAAFNETFSDHWSFEPMATTAEWDAFVLQASNFRPDLTRIALAGDEVAGYSLNRLDAEDNARTGMQGAWIGQLGVRRPWRKQGLASALLVASMRAFRAEGLDWAVLGVDAENLTGALAIYERLGFEVYKTSRAYDKTRGSSH